MSVLGGRHGLSERVSLLIKLDPAGGRRIVEAADADLECASIVHWYEVIVVVLKGSLLPRGDLIYEGLGFRDALSVVGELSIAYGANALISLAVSLVKVIPPRAPLIREDNDTLDLGLH